MYIEYFISAEIGASQGNQKKGNIGTGKSTLRLRPKGNATVEVVRLPYLKKYTVFFMIIQVLINHYLAEIIYLIFQQLEVVPCYHYPQFKWVKIIRI